MIRALVIPADPDQPLRTLDLPRRDSTRRDSLRTLQDAVGGNIQALPLPPFLPSSDAATGYVNEEGKFDPNCPPNMRATDFMVPGVGLFFGDYVAGDFVLVGFDPRTGGHRDVPDDVERRARLIAREAA